MSLSRRTFLSAGAASAAVVSGGPGVPDFLLRAAAAPTTAESSSDRILVVVQLSGGNDGLNTVVPYADDQYGRNRFQTRIGRSAVHKIDDYLGLHPAMEGMYRLLQDGRLSIVQGVGYANPNRSHFESMDIWHTAHVGSTDRDARQAGWLGRYLDAAQADGRRRVDRDVPAVHLGKEVQPLALAGLRIQVPSIGSLDDFRFEDEGRGDSAVVRQRLVAADRANADELIAHVRTAAQTAIDSSERVRQAISRSRGAGEYPRTSLGQKLRGIGQLIEAGLSTRVFYASLDGFDTHSVQAEAHAGLLRELSGAVTAFIDHMTAAGQADRVLLVAFSEFGRRVKENASRGTDHGAAAPMLLAGGKVRGGLVGAHPSLADLEDGDLKYHTDFRRVYASILENWLGVDSKLVLGDVYEPLSLF